MPALHRAALHDFAGNEGRDVPAERVPRYGPGVPDLAARARTLLDLHRASEILTLTNVWDVISAQVVAKISLAEAS